MITPHVGEMARLTGLTIDRFLIRMCRFQKFSQERGSNSTAERSNYGCMSRVEGYLCNTVENSGMATAGSGDVLTGLFRIDSQGYHAFDAAALGAFYMVMPGTGSVFVRRSWHDSR